MSLFDFMSRSSFIRHCSEYDNSYSFGSPTDDWPSMSSPDTVVDESTKAAVRSHMRRGPLNTMRRVAGKVKGIIVQ